MLTVSCSITALFEFVFPLRFLVHLFNLDRVNMVVVCLELNTPEVDMLGLDMVDNTSAVLVVQDIAVVVVAGMKRLQLL